MKDEPRIKVTALFDKDNETAKLVEEFLQGEYKKHQNFMNALARVKFSFEKLYGFPFPERLSEDLIKGVIKDDLDNVMQEKVTK